MKASRTVLALAMLAGSGCRPASRGRSLHELIAEDIAPRVASAWELSPKEAAPGRLLSDCEFKGIDLNGDGVAEVVVKVNLYAECRGGQKHNIVRSAHGSGDFCIYTVTGRRPKLIGHMQGDSWSLLASRSHGYADLRTYSHWAATEGSVGIYSYSGGKYKLKSNGLYDFSGPRPRLIEQLKKQEPPK